MHAVLHLPPYVANSQTRAICIVLAFCCRRSHDHREALDTSMELSSHYLITDWVWTLVKEGRISEIIDQKIRQRGVESIKERFVLVGILCPQTLRPRMVEAMMTLEGKVEIP